MMEKFYLQPHVIFKPSKAGALLYDRISHRQMRLNPTAAEMLTAMLSGSSAEYLRFLTEEYKVEHGQAESDLQSLAAQLAEMDVITGEANERRVFSPHTPVMERARIRLTNACNLKCAHCFVSAVPDRHAELETAEWKNVIGQLAEFDLLELTFTGGEPLVHKDFFVLAQFANQLGMPIGMNTNGLLIDDDVLAELKKLNLTTVKLSLDGAGKETHEQLRGSGTFEKVMETAEKLIRNGIKVVFDSVITKNNFHEIEAIIKLAHQVGAADYFLVECSMEGRANEKLLPVALTTAEIVELQKKVLFSKINAGIEELDTGDKKTVCSAGVDNFMIFANGDVAPCVSLYNLGQTAGNVRNQPVTGIWQESELFVRLRATHVDNIPGCRDCEFRYYCGGGCRAKAWASSGFPGGRQDSWECAWRKQYFSSLLKTGN